MHGPARSGNYSRPVTAARPSLADRIRSLVDVFWRELAKFGVVGAIAFLIDFGGFHLLFYGPLEGRLTTAKVLSGAVATTFAWVGNRLWTFRHRRNRPVHHEALLFFVVNGVGLVIATGWLNFTHDLLGMTSRSAVSINTVLGIALATVFRFWAYRQVVFAGERPGDPEPAEDAPERLLDDGPANGAHPGAVPAKAAHPEGAKVNGGQPGAARINGVPIDSIQIEQQAQAVSERGTVR